MLPFILVSVVVLLLGAAVLWMMLRAFRVKPEKYLKTPADHGIPFEEIRFPTKNGKQLFGWWMDAGKPAPTLVLVHGWGKNAGSLLPYIEHLYGNGFNLLAFDSRSHGYSDTDGYSTMLKFAEDLSAAMDFADSSKSESNGVFYVLGLSIGGAAAVFTAAREPRIKKVVTVGAPANPADVMAYQFRKKRVPGFVIRLLFEIIQWKIGARFKTLAAENNIAQARASFLLIHGTDDRVVPLEQGHKIFAAAGRDKAQLWEILGAGHSNCHYQPGFWERVLEFLS